MIVVETTDGTGVSVAVAVAVTKFVLVAVTSGARRVWMDVVVRVVVNVPVSTMIVEVIVNGRGGGRLR